MMSPQNAFDPYKKLSALLEKHTGQILVAGRYWRVEMALKPVMREHSIPDIGALISVLNADNDGQLSRQCVEAMINNETCFFRDQANFALLTGPIFDAMRAHRSTPKRLRIWSSACSTGQEAYSLAMMFAENPEKWQGWNIQIMATDVSKAALDQARSGRYSQFEIQRGLPVMMMLKYFTQDGETWTANEALRKMVSFAEHNALQSPRHLGQFDIILCRNMLMYLCDEKRKKALELLDESIAPDGMLMLGAAETVIGQTDKFRASTEFRGFYEKSDRLASRSMFASHAAV